MPGPESGRPPITSREEAARRRKEIEERNALEQRGGPVSPKEALRAINVFDERRAAEGRRMKYEERARTISALRKAEAVTDDVYKEIAAKGAFTGKTKEQAEAERERAALDERLIKEVAFALSGSESTLKSGFDQLEPSDRDRHLKAIVEQVKQDKKLLEEVTKSDGDEHRAVTVPMIRKKLREYAADNLAKKGIWKRLFGGK